MQATRRQTVTGDAEIAAASARAQARTKPFALIVGYAACDRAPIVMHNASLVPSQYRNEAVARRDRARRRS